MSYKRHLYNPEARKAEAEMREREAIKDHAYESFELLQECYKSLAPVGPGAQAICDKLLAHFKKIKGGK
jgi:hypothetical protein